MKTLGWMTVGVTYFLMVWGNLAGTTASSNAAVLLNTAYLITALFVLSGLITFACFCTWKDPTLTPPSPKVKRLATVGLIALLIQVCLGAVVRQSHSGLACSRFPNCLESFFPIPFTFETGIAFFHRWWGVLLLGLFFHLNVAAAKTLPALAKPARVTFILAVVQVVLGIGTVMGKLDTGSRVMHAAVGYALWGSLFYIAIRSGGLPWMNRLMNQKTSKDIKETSFAR